MSRYKTTEDDFTAFKEECLRLVALYGLTNWGLRFRHKASSVFEQAYISRTLDNHTAVVYLDLYWDDRPERPEILSAAKHEVIHLLIGELVLLAKDRSATEWHIDRAEEQLIHKLETLLP